MISIARLLFVLTLPISCLAQVQFEKGYVIDRNGSRVECLIENHDWKNNPSKFRYKLSENDDVKETKATDVSEFGIEPHMRYVAADVEIDRTGDNPDNTTADRNPVWTKERLFLLVLIEGKASLLSYRDGNFERFFYQSNGRVKQLIYKKYTLGAEGFGINAGFRQQLRSDVWCGEMTEAELKRFDYTNKDLVTFFKNFNECSGSAAKDFTTLASSKRKGRFHFRVTPGVNFASFVVSTNYGSPVRTYEINFGDKLGFRMGVEFEWVLPYNKNKWSLVFEPNFQSFESTVSNNWSAKINTFEIPIGIRHYFFLGDESKIFVNGLYVLGMPGSSKVSEGSDEVEIDSTVKFAAGAGYSFSRFSIEGRYYFGVDMLGEQLYWEGRYNRFSVILGYRL